MRSNAGYQHTAQSISCEHTHTNTHITICWLFCVLVSAFQLNQITIEWIYFAAANENQRIEKNGEKRGERKNKIESGEISTWKSANMRNTASALGVVPIAKETLAFRFRVVGRTTKKKREKDKRKNIFKHLNQKHRAHPSNEDFLSGKHSILVNDEWRSRSTYGMSRTFKALTI